MKQNFGRVSRNASEEIRVWLHEVQGELQVELRVYDRSVQGGGISLPEPEGLVVPIHALSELCQILEQVHKHLFKKDLVDVPSMRNLITADDPIKLHLVVEDPSGPQSQTHHEPPVTVKVPVECYLLDAPDTWPAEQVTGETRDLSSEGAQVWLPREFAAGSRLAVLIIIGELHFRGHAEVVGTAPSPQDGSYPHSLQWVSLSPQAKAALSKIIDTAK